MKLYHFTREFKQRILMFIQDYLQDILKLSAKRDRPTTPMKFLHKSFIIDSNVCGCSKMRFVSKSCPNCRKLVTVSVINRSALFRGEIGDIFACLQKFLVDFIFLSCHTATPNRANESLVKIICCKTLRSERS